MNKALWQDPRRLCMEPSDQPKLFEVEPESVEAGRFSINYPARQSVALPVIVRPSRREDMSQGRIPFFFSPMALSPALTQQPSSSCLLCWTADTTIFKFSCWLIQAGNACLHNIYRSERPCLQEITLRLSFVATFFKT